MARASDPASPPRTRAPRRIPKQRRSREIVEAIVSAARLLLDEGGPEAVTTNRIAERAGVSIGSLYRYFSDKAAILAAVYDSDASQEASELASGDWELEGEPLLEGLRAVVDFQLERHRRLLEMEGSFYRGHHRDFSLAHRIGTDAVEQRIARVLIAHAEQVRVRDVEQAAFLVARGISAILRVTVEDRPEKLYQDSFRQELLDLVVRYVATDPATR
ncbi:MAG: TetR/AcrR family transcriptional regulator [Myxococcota bacterium]